jgi:hypothetical protein
VRIENAESVEIDVHRWYARIVVTKDGVEKEYHVGTTPGNGLLDVREGKFDDYPEY